MLLHPTNTLGVVQPHCAYVQGSDLFPNKNNNRLAFGNVTATESVNRPLGRDLVMKDELKIHCKRYPESGKSIYIPGSVSAEGASSC